MTRYCFCAAISLSLGPVFFSAIYGTIVYAASSSSCYQFVTPRIYADDIFFPIVFSIAVAISGAYLCPSLIIELSMWSKILETGAGYVLDRYVIPTV